MHPGTGTKRKRCPSPEDTNLDQQQHTLFDVSVLKLQQEQLRHGVEPRLLRFVLINNALRALQSHMLRLVEGDDGSLLGPFDCDPFLCNTFRKHGTVSTAPLTPAKIPKLEPASINDKSPLVVSHPGAEGEPAGMTSSSDKRSVNSLAKVNQSCLSVHLGKHPEREDTPVRCLTDAELVGEERKKPCLVHLTRFNGTNGLYNILEQTPNGHVSPPPSSSSAFHKEDEDDDDDRGSTPSPIDFAKVDTTLYDYDPPTSLCNSGSTVPTQTQVLPRDTTKPKSPTCALQAIASPVVQNGDALGHRNLRPATPEPGGVVGEGESEFLEDLDHIVSLLMT